MGFPEIRLRRLRSNEAVRKLVRQTVVSVDDLVYPLFVCPGENIKKPIDSMDGCFYFSADMVAAEANEAADLGIPAVLLFGLPNEKDETGSEVWAEVGAVQQAIRAIKKTVPELIVITDVCLCAYTESGHCGVIKNDKIDNDASCELLARTALSHAQAGADMVSPSDMMDGRVGAIRGVLEKNDCHDTAIMAYSAKYASAFYGPFRDVADSKPAFGDRKSYQMDPANSDEAMAEIAQDIEEGADIVMVKPALSYLDIIHRAKERFDCPVAAYNVSGEYMMLNAAAKEGLIDKERSFMEVIYSMKRAGADIIITYFAKEVAMILKGKGA